MFPNRTTKYITWIVPVDLKKIHLSTTPDGKAVFAMTAYIISRRFSESDLIVFQSKQ